MKKIISILVCVCVLLSAMVFTASAASATISFADKANRTQFNDEIQVWEQNGITVTNNRNGAYSKVGDYNGRFYKDTEVIIEYPDMTAIVIDSTNIESKYIAWDSSFTDSNATAVVADSVTTITFSEPVDSFTFAKMSAQSRANTITVYTGGSAPTPPATDEDDKDDTTTSAVTLVDAPVAGTAYKFAMDQTNVGQLLFANGEMSSHYMATVTDPASAIDVYLEEVSGGYNLCAMVGGAKKYLNMVVNGTYVNAVYGDTAESVFTYDATLKTVVTEINNSTYAFGTYDNYKTIGTSDVVKYPDNFFARFYTVGATDGGDVTPPAGDGEDKEEDTPVELPAPDATNTLSIKDAIALGAAQDTGVYTADKYYVTGKITAVSNTQYGNIYIADEDGNEILVYGTYGADGKDRYDALASKPDEGDTVTVYGVVGNFKGTPQLKNAWIIEFTAGELDVEAPTEPEADSVLTIEEAIELGLTKRSNEFTTNKYYVTGVITEIYNEEYGNMKITDDAGNILTLYGTWEVLDEIRFDAMENKPAVGDTITVYGVIGQYNGTPQMKNGVFTTAPVTDDDNDDTTTGDNTTGGTTGGNANTDNSTTSPSTGDNVGAIVAMAVAAAAVLVASKKR